MTTPTALIVDDSLTVRMDLAETFGGAGWDVRVCATLRDARAALAVAIPDAVVLDMLLPDGDGVELLREIRETPELAAIAVLMLSTEAEVRNRIRGLSGGADEYVGKPYDGALLVERALQVMRARGAGVAAEPTTTILVIDDSPTFRAQIADQLTVAGYQVRQAASGEEGLRLTVGWRPAAILVDEQMPGIDGGTVIRRVRLDAALRSVPCLMLTGADDRNAELRALDAGADGFLRKEADSDVLLAKLAAVLRASGEAPAAVADSHRPQRVLAVDDSATFLHALADTLREDGYDLAVAASGEEALELLAVQPVDCILLDLMMPGLGGHETCRRIKSAPGLRDIPLIMLTALEGRAALLEGLTAGADDFIPKSGEMEVLKARVRAQIRRKRFEDEHRHVREELLQRQLEATESRAARELAEARALLVTELERKNGELEAFCYSVSHDLRAPLRSIDGFSRILVEEHASALDDDARVLLQRVCGATRRMAELIDDLLALSRVGNAALHRAAVDLSALAGAVVEELRRRDPARRVDVEIEPGLIVDADPGLLKIVLENLFGNAWKFTGTRTDARITLTQTMDAGEPAYLLQDNGAGFDMAYVEKLFRPFQRLHTGDEFPGTGIGLATVQRIVQRHGGLVEARGQPGAGAVFRFTLGQRDPRLP